MKVYQQSVFNIWPMENESCQSIITSPPYYNLRKYAIPDVAIGGSKDCNHVFTKKYSQGYCDCGAWEGQYGLEPSFYDYIEHTILWVREAWRVLKKDGIMFLNIGDTYGTVSGSMGSGKYLDPKLSVDANAAQPKKNNLSMHKCKLLIPHRIAIGLIDDGWILRNDIIWFKNNALPESVKDRYSKKYENIFMFTKSSKYYFDLDAVRIQWQEDSIARLFRGNGDNQRYSLNKHGQSPNTMSTRRPNRTHEYKSRDPEKHINPKGRNPGDVWSLNNQPSPIKHYAMWPCELVKRLIICSTKPGDLVCDPFAGSATTLKVADELNREAIGIDLGYEDVQKIRLREIQKVLL